MEIIHISAMQTHQLVIEALWLLDVVEWLIIMLNTSDNFNEDVTSFRTKRIAIDLLFLDNYIQTWKYIFIQIFPINVKDEY